MNVTLAGVAPSEVSAISVAEWAGFPAYITYSVLPFSISGVKVAHNWLLARCRMCGRVLRQKIEGRHRRYCSVACKLAFYKLCRRFGWPIGGGV